MKIKFVLAALLNVAILATAPTSGAQWGNNPPPIRPFGTPNGHGFAGRGVFNASIQGNHNRIDIKHEDYLYVSEAEQYNITEALFDFWWPQQCAPTLRPATFYPLAAQLRFPKGCMITSTLKGQFVYNGVSVGGEFTINPGGYRNNQRLVFYSAFIDSDTGEFVFRFGN